jgi:hypothetical protein
VVSKLEEALRVQKSGYFSKKSGMVMARWQRRYWVLYEHHFLKYWVGGWAGDRPIRCGADQVGCAGYSPTGHRRGLQCQETLHQEPGEVSGGEGRVGRLVGPAGYPLLTRRTAHSAGAGRPRRGADGDRR